MRFAIRLKSLALRVRLARGLNADSDPNLTRAAPLLELLPQAEPLPELFTRIEQQLNADSVAALAPPRRRSVVHGAVFFSAGAVLGAVACSAVWVWSFTQDDPELWDLLRATCSDRSEITVTIHSGSGDSDKKIVVPCIF